MDEANLRAARILMLDDSVANTCLASNVLQRLGFTNLESINDPRYILQKIESYAPDLLLLDLAMPEVSGFDVLQLMRKSSGAASRLPVIVITGDATPANKRRALANGATDLLAKPFDPSEANIRIRNVLERQMLQQQIEEQNRLLEQRVSERTQQLEHALDDLKAAQRQMLNQARLSAFAEMAGGVVHDFSNALMTVIGYSEMLLTGDGRALTDREKTLEFIRIINTAGRDAAEVVSRLRDFYRPRATAEAQVVNLKEVLHLAVLMTQPKWKDPNRPSGTEIVVEVELQHLPVMRGNPAELREMITNLIFNAVDAMPNGGTVTLRTSEAAGSVLLEVADTGMGMTPEVRARCLDPFFSTKGDEGTGLGLAMVFGIVQRQEGQIDIESTPGVGTTFRINLPVARDMDESAVEPAECKELLAQVA
ncbi:MAG TPA: hybrid sensor histidine kinase/response regulator [Chthoniobacterales bacterium]|nr:hybrid sensor histidine kinase/response regulator [Chthoniobacterales bacterium]